MDPLLEAGHEIVLREDGAQLSAEELVGFAADCDGIVCHLTDRIDTAVLESGRGGRLRVVANAAVGYDNIDVAAATAMGITVCNTPGVLDDTTADLAFLLILTATRRASDAERDLREGRWTGWGFGTHLARDVHGATLGLVGFGRIARAVAERANGFAMEVIHTTRHDTGVAGFVATLNELLERSDIVSLHVPLNETTRHLIGAAELDRMKTTAVLVNTARGPVVDEDALVDALESGSIYAAGLDVYDGEPKVNPRILTAPRTTLLPHIGSATIATRTRMARLACQGVCDVLAGRTPPNMVVPAPAAL
jgi:glyoxylate reductase